MAALASSAIATALAAEPITDANSAIEAAKRYVKARCTAAAPCKFRPQREGKQWRVWVDLPKRNARDAATHIVLFFDMNGNLIRRLETD
jgi:hypothetical protein